jgi:FlaA1/EpsC-like NDP-sugar epimerase
VRYGNVLYSTGSVLYKWKRLLQLDKELIVTDLNCTRFYWTVGEAITLIFNCLELANSAKPYVPEMKSIILKDLLTAMSRKYLKKGGTLKIKEIGLRQGENLHESLDKKHKNSFESDKYSIDEIISFI